ncbi:hypothetical protein [Clostridium cibarium]|uniref:Uncharacterized protein n=1 Tax=Clostridium cibarium TaxID=2762247 RepID=A0ABR8PVZ6_9CLOT|nr:hypothetical protein [Clostridium cibarium]MBD7912336.1 hypothetical protein [Clostridium cibarium]
MLISEAIQFNSKSLIEAENEYKKNVIMVTRFMVGVRKTKLHAFNNNPPGYDDFVKAFQRSKVIARDWEANVYEDLIITPRNVKKHNNHILHELTAARKQAKYLVTHPTDKEERLY